MCTVSRRNRRAHGVAHPQLGLTLSLSLYVYIYIYVYIFMYLYYMCIPSRAATAAPTASPIRISAAVKCSAVAAISPRASSRAICVST